MPSIVMAILLFDAWPGIGQNTLTDASGWPIKAKSSRVSIMRLPLVNNTDCAPIRVVYLSYGNEYREKFNKVGIALLLTWQSNSSS